MRSLLNLLNTASTRVVIAGSRRLPRGQAPRLLIRFLVNLPEDAMILLRRPKDDYRTVSSFELDVAELCNRLMLRVQWCSPTPTLDVKGRAATYLRDVEMTASASLVLAFVHPDDAANQFDSGTMHVIEKAQDAGTPVYAYSVNDDGRVERIGEFDPEAMWSEKVPVP